jgi:hypothetical protein
MSVDSSYFNEMATKFKTDMAKVVINDSIEISSFAVEDVSANVYELIFNVLASATTQIDSIKLKKGDNTLLLSDTVDIPITEDEVVIRHLVTISEVID